MSGEKKQRLKEHQKKLSWGKKAITIDKIMLF